MIYRDYRAACFRAEALLLIIIIIIMTFFFGQQLALGGARYGGRDYLFVALVVGGTILLTVGGESSSSSSSPLLHDDSTAGGGLSPNNHNGNGGHSSWTSVLCIIGSLAMDGITAGLQKHIQTVTQPNVYDFLTFTNTAMVVIAFSISILSNEWRDGMNYLRQNPRCVSILWRCCLCSAIGQSFIFYIIATFDPLVLSTITTTRKILSVLLSIFLKGHVLTQQGVTGLGMALTGLLIEIQGKLFSNRRRSTTTTAAATTTTTTVTKTKQSKRPAGW
jgi:solute carrier family 35 (UDP-galactose transporter), member B1